MRFLLQIDTGFFNLNEIYNICCVSALVNKLVTFQSGPELRNFDKNDVMQYFGIITS